jgi:hypothetical protein
VLSDENEKPRALHGAEAGKGHELSA